MKTDTQTPILTKPKISSGVLRALIGKELLIFGTNQRYATALAAVSAEIVPFSATLLRVSPSGNHAEVDHIGNSYWLLIRDIEEIEILDEGFEYPNEERITINGDGSVNGSVNAVGAE